MKNTEQGPQSHSGSKSRDIKRCDEQNEEHVVSHQSDKETGRRWRAGHRSDGGVVAAQGQQKRSIDTHDDSNIPGPAAGASRDYREASSAKHLH